MVYTLPPRYDVLPPTVIYRTTQFVPVRQLDTSIGEYTVGGLHASGMDAWIADLHRRFRVDAIGHSKQRRAPKHPADNESADALKRILNRTGWSLRKAAEFLGCSHIQIARVRDGASVPRDNLAQAIADADLVTQVLFPTAGHDPSTLSRMLLSRPIDGADESAIDAFNRGDVRRAMALARRVRYPRITGMIGVAEAPFGKYDAVKTYSDED